MHPGDVKVWLGGDGHRNNRGGGNEKMRQVGDGDGKGKGRQYAQQREAVERESAADKAAAAVAAAMSRGLYRPADVSKGADQGAEDDAAAAAAAAAIIEEEEGELDDDVEGDECFMGCVREASAASKSAARQVIRRLDLIIGLASLSVAIWLRVSRGRERSPWRWVLFIACIFLGECCRRRSIKQKGRVWKETVILFISPSSTFLLI